MKKRNSLQIMFQLAGLIKGLTGYMLLAISMGTIGHLCATFIPVPITTNEFNAFPMLTYKLDEPILATA